MKDAESLPKSRDYELKKNEWSMKIDSCEDIRQVSVINLDAHNLTFTIRTV